jgi:hypothetical protein
MLDGLEWLIWFLIVGSIIIFIYMITMHFVLKEEKKIKNKELKIYFLEELVIEERKREEKNILL